jgi:hypothetical protein
VTIANSVTNIGESAFHYCTGLTNVTIGNGVTIIADGAFSGCSGLTSVTIPNSVINIFMEAFKDCTGLTNVTIGNSVTRIGWSAFSGCTGLTTVTIPNSATSIGSGAFGGCTGLTSVTIGKSLSNIADSAFFGCTELTGAFFKGNAPTSVGSLVFSAASKLTVYHPPGTLGWGATFAGRPAVLWDPVIPTFGIKANGFGFRITGTANIPIVVEAATDLVGGIWVPLQSASLTNGFFDFTDPGWTNYTARFYRVRSP